MYEIELKAHVLNRQDTITLINSFAEYLGTTFKDDSYFRFQKPDSDQHITCRIRIEKYTFPDNTKKTQALLTYKAKERRSDSSGSTFEVNEEHESIISDPATLEKLLLDTGYVRDFKKQKDVMQWTCPTPYGTAHLELCTVEPLGDFLEIEVVTETCTNEEAILEELKKLIVNSGIPLDQIEKRYYRELLLLAKGETNV